MAQIRKLAWLPAMAWLCLAWSCSGTHTSHSGARSSDREKTALQSGPVLIDAAALRSGGPLAVRSSTRIAPGSYRSAAASADLRQGVLVIENASDITLDLSGVELTGRASGASPDADRGAAIVIKSSDRVTVKGGKIGGYKVCIAAFDCQDLVIDGVEFDDYYRSRLLSTSVAEDPLDWLYPHENDADEWIENYGAAISLTDCRAVTVKACRGRHGQNGILLTRSRECVVFDNDFSFLSGWGLALYRSSLNTVSHNVFDYCVRGYSHGKYWRGQDSAGILMFERSCDNLFAYNSATHGGDGVFLYGGQDTVQGRAFDRGELDAGGSDRNVWYRNDFSYAVANSIEATFSSDNWALENQLSGSHQHGVWGGYSRHLVVLGNTIHDTLGGGVSIEHGQDCVIADNTFERNDQAIELWWDDDTDLVGGPFGRHRDTSSRDAWILGNEFDDNVQDIVLKKTTGVVFSANRFRHPERALYLDRVEGVLAAGSNREGPRGLEVRAWMAGVDGSLPSGHVSDSTLKLHPGAEPQALARARAFRAPPLPGGSENPRAERKGGLETIVMGEWGPWDFRSGEPRPEPRAPGGLLARIRWDATWFSWRGGVDPRADVDGWRALQFQPAARGEVGPWVNPWGDDTVRKRVGEDHFGLIATADVSLETSGRYVLSAVSDDGVRIKVDGRTVLENWTWHAALRDSVELELASGAHRFELEYFQIDGATALVLSLEQAKP